MDFWSRLLSPLAANPRKDHAKDPAKRLNRFEKEYADLLSTWRTSSNLSRDSEAAETLEICLQELTNILNDESRRPLPHPCIQYASIKQIYVPIGKIATTSYNEWIIKEAVLLFATLVESEEEAFVETSTFSASLTNLLVRITGANSVPLGMDTESRVVELAFNITTKIRLDPAILPAWFKSPLPEERGDKAQDNQGRFAGKTQRVDFPLFYILVDYIHHEGKIGDFARTGLLYIIESASSSAALERWIVESDLSTLMATGLGALYSQLSRKLVIDHLPHDLPPVLALSDYQHPVSSYEIISSCSPDFQSHLETFLSHLLFWQDVLNHCRSIEVKSTLLEHFQVIFLQQLLYPSLLESSDIDGGSSVAVLTYLRRILESLDHPEMINLILHYLLALPDALASSQKTSRTAVSDARKRKSMDLTRMMLEKAEEPATPLLFNLVDLVLSCLRSRNQQTIRVALQLVSAILKRHHRYATFTLLRTDVLPNKGDRRTVGAHEQEIDFFTTLAGSIGGKADFDEIYSYLLKDTTSRLESHPSSLRLITPQALADKHNPSEPAGAWRDAQHHALRPEDPLSGVVTKLVETFFLNPVETNLSLTETIADLAACGNINLEGWLARSPDTYAYEEEKEGVEQEDGSPVTASTPVSTSASAAGQPQENTDDMLSDSLDEQQRLKSMERCRSRPKWESARLPRILHVLKSLTDQVATYREKIPRFEELLEQRRNAFQTAEAMLETPSLPVRTASQKGPRTPERPSLDEARGTGSPSRPSGLEVFAQRFLSELSELGTPSRSGSPKGRKEQKRRTGTPASSVFPGGARTSTPNNTRTPPPEFNANSSDARRSGSRRAFSPAGTGTDVGATPGEQDPVAQSQASAFAAIDQSILARRVGLSDDRVKPIPFNPHKEAPPASVTDEAETSMVDQYDDGGSTAEPDTSPSEQTVSVSHVLTNVIILQYFLLELASLMQVRAGLFDEVRYV